MTKIVFLNGPPGCGKDTAVKGLIPYINFVHKKFSSPIKQAVAALFDRNVGWIEENKDKEAKMLMRGTHSSALAKYDTPRQLLIAMSEDLLKPRYGEEFFGHVMVNAIVYSGAKLVIISDSGFLAEANPLVRKFGHVNCLQVRIHRKGHTFDGDSRSIWTHPHVQFKNVYNDAGIHELTMGVLYAIVRTFDPPLLREPVWIK